jgi:hypothetical protein
MKFSFNFSEVRALADDQKEIAEVVRLRADTAGILIRAGYEANSVTEALHLPEGLVHTGLVPVTVQGEQLAEGGNTMSALLPATRGVQELESTVDREYLDSTDDTESVIQKSFNKLGQDADSILGRAISDDEAEPDVTRAAPTWGISGETLIPFTYDATLAPRRGAV